MPLMKTSNPALGENTFRNAGGGLIDATARMTLIGTVNKTGMLLILTFASAAWTWFKYLSAGTPGAVGGLIDVVEARTGRSSSAPW